MNAQEVGAGPGGELDALRGGHHLRAHPETSGQPPNLGFHSPLQSGWCMRCVRSAGTSRVSCLGVGLACFSHSQNTAIFEKWHWHGFLGKLK